MNAENINLLKSKNLVHFPSPLQPTFKAAIQKETASSIRPVFFTTYNISFEF